MSFMAILKTIFTFLPELIGLVKKLHEGVSNGISHAVLRSRLKAIDKAFGHQDRRRAARELNNAFKK
jgi:Mn-dependent DtxR family transcriptional regulator